ncbi:dynein light chain type 1 [Ancylostoma duodenale]|uniref:Dynein light chain n=1 Tax=Ancylostoma duodenale TaxID=51022 RepID=A0A0C2HCP2_9BILA|nr:dynein light chain type 1 [Ancylostoma duodenale]
MSDEKLEVKESDMEEAEQSVVIAVVREAQRLYNVDKDVAAFIKEELDKQLGATWHIICGKCFGSRVSYEMGHFLLLKCNKTVKLVHLRKHTFQVNVMIFKCGY